MSAQKFSYLLSIVLVFAFIGNSDYSLAATQTKPKINVKTAAKNKTSAKNDKATKNAKNSKNSKTAKNAKNDKISNKSAKNSSNKKGVVENNNNKNLKTANNKNKNIIIKNRNNNNAAVAKKAAEVNHFEQYATDGSLNFRSGSVLVINQNNGEIMLEKNSHKVVPIASVSKLMTAMVVLDAKLPMNGVITIDENDIDHRKHTTSRLPFGTRMTRETAMLLALMSSENRAANALGRHYPGGLSAFVKAMNKKAKSLGMYNTHFVEPTGLSNKNVSTAQDLAKMVKAATKYSEIRQFTTTAEATLDLNGELKEYRNSNSLVRGGEWDIGVSKTGYISEAGRCLVMQAALANRPYIIVLLDSHTTAMRVADANSIKNWVENSPVVASSYMKEKNEETRHRSMTTNAGGYYVY